MTDTVNKRSFLHLFAILLLSFACKAQAPNSFRWVDFKSEPTVVSKLNQILIKEDFTAIREIGIINDDAIVFVTLRDRDPQVQLPDYDIWVVYNVSLKTTEYSALVMGYKIEIASWLQTYQGTDADLGIAYLDCYECEPAKIFTAFHYNSNSGWQARWPDPKNPKQPGIPLDFGDAGEPYTDEAVDQVWALIAPEKAGYFVGTWYHSRDLRSGKVSSRVAKYYVDSHGVEKKEELSGKESELFRLKFCKPEYGVDGVVGGQETNSCRQLIKAAK